MLYSRSAALTALAAVMIAGGALPAADGEKNEAAAKQGDSAPLTRAMKDGVDAMKKRDWKRAAAAWSDVVKQDAANAGAWANLGKVQLQQKETAAAIASLEKAVALQPALAEAWMALGMAYDSEKAPMRAVSCLTRAVHENPGDARTRNSLAIVLKRAGWTGAAESELQKALDLDPRYAEAHFNLAVMYLEKRPPSLEMARRHYEAARQLGAEPDREMEAELAGAGPAVESAPEPAARKLPAKESFQSKPTRSKP